MRIYDVNSQIEVGPRFYHLVMPHGEKTWAAVSPVGDRVLRYGQPAWPYVGCIQMDSANQPMWVPVEAVVDDSPKKRLSQKMGRKGLSLGAFVRKN
jgi:hypothetical protein